MKSGKTSGGLDWVMMPGVGTNTKNTVNRGRRNRLQYLTLGAIRKAPLQDWRQRRWNIGVSFPGWLKSPPHPMHMPAYAHVRTHCTVFYFLPHSCSFSFSHSHFLIYSLPHLYSHTQAQVNPDLRSPLCFSSFWAFCSLVWIAAHLFSVYHVKSHVAFAELHCTDKHHNWTSGGHFKEEKQFLLVC